MEDRGSIQKVPRRAWKDSQARRGERNREKGRSRQEDRMRDGEEAAKQGFEVGERQEPTGGDRTERRPGLTAKGPAA